MDIKEIKKEQYQYIWYSLFKYISENKEAENIRYIISQKISPYMEMNMEDINYDNVLSKNDKLVLEMNPFYRFSHIFGGILDPELTEYEELRKEMINIVTHMLSNIDLQEGLNKRILINRIIINQIEIGIYGEEVASYFEVLKRKEKIVVANGIQDKYKYSREIEIFKRVFNKIFHDSIIYDSLENQERIVLYINEMGTEKVKQKEKLLEKLFLPMGLKTKIFYHHHFGIMGNKETLEIGNFVVF